MSSQPAIGASSPGKGAKAVTSRLLADAKPTAQNAFKVKLAERTLAGVLAQVRT